MIADMIPLLLFTAAVVIARNLFEAYVLHREEQRTQALELARIRRPREHRPH